MKLQFLRRAYASVEVVSRPLNGITLGHTPYEYAACFRGDTVSEGLCCNQVGDRNLIDPPGSLGRGILADNSRKPIERSHAR